MSKSDNYEKVLFFIKNHQKNTVFYVKNTVFEVFSWFLNYH